MRFPLHAGVKGEKAHVTWPGVECVPSEQKGCVTCGANSYTKSVRNRKSITMVIYGEEINFLNLHRTFFYNNMHVMSFTQAVLDKKKKKTPSVLQA